LQEGRPYEIAFVDVRMPPGWDGIEVAPRLWMADPDLQIVICTAYSDYTWEEMFAKVGATDRMFVLKKPFDRDEILQLAHSLSEKRRLSTQIKKITKASPPKIIEETGHKFETEIIRLKHGEGI
jgi:DNA-binding NtrC family response regulator